MEHDRQQLSPTKHILALLLKAEYHAGWAIDMAKYGMSSVSHVYITKNFYSYYDYTDYSE